MIIYLFLCCNIVRNIGYDGYTFREDAPMLEAGVEQAGERNYTSYQSCPRIVALADIKYDEEYFTKYEELMANTKEINFCDAMILVLV